MEKNRSYVSQFTNVCYTLFKYPRQNRTLISKAMITQGKRNIVPIVVKYRLGKQPNTAAYWRTQSYQARLEALEQIRQEYIRWKYNADPGFQRVYQIIKR